MFAQVFTLLVPFSLLALAFVSRDWANARAKKLRTLVAAAITIQLVVAAFRLVPVLLETYSSDASALSTANEASGATAMQQFVDNLGHYDGISALMFLLVSFVGMVVCRFSIRYLDGESNQGNYFRWLGFVLGAVSLLVVAGNLFVFFAAWVMTSFGLHQLLMHYGDRPWAKRAARTKFVISRFGDLFLLAALVLVYREFGTYHLAEILSEAKNTVAPSWQLSMVGWFLMLGAVTKSAQFPVHFWLPETMEAPTPVSALMHAGIVNAGGYLLIRMSPVVAHAPAALATLAIIGGFTAVFAGTVMMTQPNIKRSLGYSTIAQMGFMMLQCGLGAFSAAMLHIIAHSLYKAHAFLRTGDAWRVERIPKESAAKPVTQQSELELRRWTELACAIGFTVISFAAVSRWFELSLSSKAGGVVLSAIICLAIATLIASSLSASWRTITFTLVTGVLLITAYIGSFLVVSSIINPLVPAIQLGVAATVIGCLLVFTFAALVVLQMVMPATTRQRCLQRLYVHAANGFYVDTIVRRSLGLSLTKTPSAA